MNLVNRGINSRTRGHGIEAFEHVKNNLMKALEITKEILEGEDLYGELKSSQSSSIVPTISNKIFIVHGRDQSLKTDTERFLRELGLIPVVLHREVDQGKTIIEKFEQHSDVGYAFILLTPNEISFPSTENDLEDSRRTKKYRTRPNVIFEFGYFIARLGRDRVCCLHKGNVEVPSDIDGLVYKKVDESIDSQGLAIIRELKAAGYQINM
jgi:predicted nucleotide-binding protein